MTASWKAAAHAGELDVDWLTPKRAVANGHAFPPNAVMLGIMYPHGEPSFSIVFTSIARVFAFCKEMRPVVVRVLGAEDEDVAPLQAALIGSEVPGGARVH